MKAISLLILIGIVSFMFVGQAVYQSDLGENNQRDIYQTTEESFNWNNYSISLEEELNNEISDDVQIEEYNINVKRGKNIIIKFIDFVGFSTFEISKWGIEYGYEHPEQDLRFFLDFLIKIFWIMLLIACIPLVVPLLAIIYLFFQGTLWLCKKLVGWKHE